MPFNPHSAIGFGRISQRLRAAAHWTLPNARIPNLLRKQIARPLDAQFLRNNGIADTGGGVR
jgi:hypothetical protein